MIGIGTNPGNLSRRAEAWRLALFHLATALVAAVTLLAPPPADATQVVALTMKETVRQADAIVVGTVTAQQTRWGNASKRWMETDFTLAVEDVIYPSEKGIPINQTIVLTYWGGTIDGETQAISDMRVPKPGERVLVMLRPGWSQAAGFTPTVGFNYGLFGISEDAASGRRSVLDFADAPLALEAQDNIVRQSEASVAADQGVDLARFSRWLRDNIGAIKSARPQPRATVDPNDPRLIKPFAKTPALTTSSAPNAYGLFESPRVGAAAAPPASPSAPVTVGTSIAPTTETLSLPPRDPGVTPQYVTLGYKPNLPIVVNNYPAAFSPWSPEDQYQMSKWNFYASDVFHVYTTPTNTYQWRDGVFDLTGWPSAADLQSVYGRPWGANEIGVTFTRYIGSTMIEADLSLNPAFSFTLDDEWVYDGGSAEGFRQVMLHELGHMLGLDHDFNYLSTMDYMPEQFRFFGMPYMDDAAGIRALYPANAVAHTDLAVYLYYADGYQSVADASYPSSVIAGNSLVVNNYHIENTGTTTIGTPTIEWYLTVARNYGSAYYYLGTTTYSSLATFTYFTPSSVQRTLTVPSTVPPGNYYLNAFIRNDSGAGQASFPFSNDFAFSRFQVQVTTVPPSAPTIGVATAGNARAIVNFSPGSLGSGTLMNYTANCGGFTNTGLSSPVTVFGLSNGVTYTCRVMTTSTHGVSGWSSYSNPVTPSAPIVGKKKTDFNGNGKSDIFWDNGSGGHWAYFMNGASVSSSAPMPSAAPGWAVVNFGDFNGDGKADVLWKNTASPSQHWIYLMNGNTVIGGGPVTVSPGYVARFVGDFNGDGKADILWENGTGSRWAYFMNGATVASALPMPGTAPGWALAGVGDFNGDGKSDLIFKNVAAPAQHWIYLINGNSVIGGGALTVGAGYSLTGAADFNGDGKADLLWENGSGSRWLYFMNGAAVSGTQPLPGAAAGWNIVGSGDFNGDGRSDVLWRNGASPTQHWIYLLNGATVIGGGGVMVSPGYSPMLPW